MTKEEQKAKSLQDYKEGVPINFDQLADILRVEHIDQDTAEWTLIRKRDRLTKWSNEIGFIDWNEDMSFKKLTKGLEGLKIDRSLILAPFNIQFTWQTTSITEFTVVSDNEITFKTLNSEYTLTKRI